MSKPPDSELPDTFKKEPPDRTKKIEKITKYRKNHQPDSSKK